MLVESGGLVEVTCKQKYETNHDPGKFGRTDCNWHQCPIKIIYDDLKVDGRQACDSTGKFKVTWTKYIRYRGLFK